MYKYRSIYRVLSFTVACLMLLTSFDYSVNLHFCQDSFAGISFDDEVKSCMSKASSCSMKKMSSTEEDPNCCKNQKVHIDDLDEDYTSPVIVDLVDQVQDLNINVDLNDLFYNFGHQVISYTSYRPPPPDTDFQVQYQVYLI